MAKRVPASMRTRQSLSDVIEGRLSSPAGREELVKLATRLIIEETLEAEARDAVGRDYYEHGAEPGSGYRNGYRPGRLKTAEGVMDYSAPQVAGRPEPYRSAIRDSVLLGKYAQGFTVEQARKYHEATYSIGMGAARRFVRQVDLAGRRQILDLGGGSGCYCIVAAQQHPG